MPAMKDIWPRLTPETRTWLASNTSESVPSAVVEDILNAQGFTVSASWFRDIPPSLLRLPREIMEWMTQANPMVETT